MWPTLKALISLGGSASIAEIEDEAIEAAGLSEEQLQEPHGDGPKSEVQYRLAWARTYLKKVGAVTNTNRGVWTITEVGRGLQVDDMADIPRRVRAEFTRQPSGRTNRAGDSETSIQVNNDATEVDEATDHESVFSDSTYTSTDAEQ